MRVRGIVKRLLPALNLFALVGILLAVLLAGCAGSQEGQYRVATGGRRVGVHACWWGD